MKILNEAHVPDKISVNHLKKIANKIFEVNRITFSNDELHVEGTEHNKALYLTVKCEDSVVTKVLVDNGSNANICPLSTLNKLKVDDERIHKNSICIRGFDGGGKDSIGDIVLELTIGSVEFTMEFQVLDVAISYNLLLGHPWIHAAKAVLSTLHQMVKFEWDRQEIIVHGDENLCAHSDASVPFIEAEDVKGPWVYQVFETVPVEKVPEGKCVPTPKIAFASVMMASEMLKNGFVLGKGLGASLFQRLFDDVNMVEVGEGSIKADVQFVGPNFFLCWFNDMTCMRNPRPSLKSQSNSEIIIQEIECDDESEYDEDELPIDPAFPPVKQKLRKFKTDMSVKIKEEVTKQLDAKVIQVTRYLTWLANVVKKDGKTRVCVDYRDLNKASPKDNFPLPNIHILIVNYSKYEIGSLVYCYAGHHQILMDEEDSEKTTFITPYGTYYYRIMPFGLKNAGATYMREMTTIFHDMIHKEIEVYVDDRLRKYNLKLNPAKCAFGVPSGKLLGFIVSQQGIEPDPSKIKAIQELPPPKNKTEEVFDKIKEYLSNPPVLVPSELGRLLILYLTVQDNSFGCVLGQHDITGRKEQAIYYLSKKFTSHEVMYTPLERTCCALTWKPMPIGRLAKWQILLTEFDIVYVTRTGIKAQALANHLAENPVDEEYEPLRTYFPDEEVIHIDELEKDEKPDWKLFFDGAANMKCIGIKAVLISEKRHHYPVTAQLHFYCTNNMVEYKAYILGLRLAMDMRVQELLDLCQRIRSVEFRHIPMIHNEVADALATLASMLHHPDKAYIDPMHI
ncbi:uncharacterized protein [Nicotiana sylvestris]|uniref:uncharacterized protein n=1 Tax=Nicotiana sylvestris TaxID=4096 RepID=UPI00388C42DA